MNAAILSLPGYRNRSARHYLYAIEFKDGRTKIGVTWSPRARAVAVSSAMGATVARAIAEPFHGEWRHRAEADALRRARRIAVQAPGGAEVFYGLKFGDAKTLLRQICRREFQAAGKPPSQTKEGRAAAAMARKKRQEEKSALIFGRLIQGLTHQQEPT